jgi:hypothetical protein
MDAARLKAGEKPEIREVEIGGRRVPYFEAGAAYYPYGEGYFVNASLVHALFTTPDFGPGRGGGSDHSWSGYDSGGGDLGGFDGGGFDGGGGGE